MTRSFSVLILDSDDYEILKVLRCLGQAPDVISHILSRAHRPLSKFSRYCNMCHYNSSKNDTEWIEVIKKIVEKYNIDVLLPTSIESIKFVSRHYNTLAEIAYIPPTPDNELLNMADDKWSFYCFIKENDLPASPTILFADQTNIISKPQALDSIEFPALLKPTREMGGRGIIKIEKRSDFFSTIEQKKALQPELRYIVQSYIPGADLCLGVFCEHGKILSYVLQKDILPQSNSFGYQKVMEYVNNDMAMEIGTKLISSMAWNGMAFIDLRIDSRDNSMKLLEVNPRLGRAFLGALTAGVNFPLNLCYSAMGINITDKQKESVRYAHPSAYINILKSRILRKPVPVKIKWSESGFKFTYNDPVPEIIYIIYKAGCKLKRRITNKHKPVNNVN
jgi:predicted ATP-grasp superfamily ATP-dependent carboligase